MSWIIYPEKSINITFIYILNFSLKITEIILIIITPIIAPRVLSIKSVMSGKPIVSTYCVDSYMQLNIKPSIIALKPEDLGYNIFM